MLHFIFETLADLIQRGGGVMWLLLGLSVVAMVLAFERCWFWFKTNSWREAQVQRLAWLLRGGQYDLAKQVAESDQSVYGRLVCHVVGESASDAALAEAVEIQRSRLERFMPTLSTIITAAPMLGILGTVLGLIRALSVFAGDQQVTDPRLISPAIAEALITTAAGLVVAIGALFPYNAFRAQVDRCLGRIETLTAAAEQGRPLVGGQVKASKISGPAGTE